MTDEPTLLVVGGDDPVPAALEGFQTAPVDQVLVGPMSRLAEGLLDLHRLMERVGPTRELQVASERVEEAMHWIERASPRMRGHHASTDHD